MMLQVPEAKEEFEDAIKKVWGHTPEICSSVLGIYRCKIGLGESPKDTFDYASNAYLKSIGIEPCTPKKPFWQSLVSFLTPIR